GPRGRVVAFEPVPRNMERLRKNIELNALHNVQAVSVAASDRCAEAVIRIPENFSTASLVWHQKDPSAKEIVIQTASIDDLVEKDDLGSPKFVKIDVEGAEGLVLQGMSRTIAATKPVLFIECSEAGQEVAWSLLHELGYRCQSAITLKPIKALDDYRHSD